MLSDLESSLLFFLLFNSFSLFYSILFSLYALETQHHMQSHRSEIAIGQDPKLETASPLPRRHNDNKNKGNEIAKKCNNRTKRGNKLTNQHHRRTATTNRYPIQEHYVQPSITNTSASCIRSKTALARRNWNDEGKVVVIGIHSIRTRLRLINSNKTTIHQFGNRTDDQFGNRTTRPSRAGEQGEEQ